ncbi:MAG: NlpC/P60 family protein [Clostridia bacterium]
MAYRLSGAKIWRDADFEKNECLSSIKLEKAQKGDLLFFKGHMAIYLNNGEFIHSSSALGRVGYGSFAENSWYGENLLKVGTIFDE